MEKHNVYAAAMMSKFEGIAHGHRACQGCAEVLALRHVLKATGKRVIVANATGCMEIISSPLPLTSWRIPWIHTAFENAAAVASGVECGLKVLMRKGRIPESKIKAIGMAGDGGTADIGIQALSGAMERGHDMLYVCFDNEAYMNTGIQRSSTTPYGASTTTSAAGTKSIGQTTWKKNMAEIMVAHGIPYVATACSSFLFDLETKVKKAMNTKGPTYLHVLSVCPTGWRTPAEKAITYGRLAVDTGSFPLYEVENGTYRITYEPPVKLPVREYLKGQGRFRHLADGDIEEIQRRTDAELEKLRLKVRMTNPAAAIAEKYVVHDPVKCIRCGRCVKVCRDTVGADALAMGEPEKGQKRGLPYLKDKNACIGCGTCNYTCPTDAIPMIESAGIRRIWGLEFPLRACGKCKRYFFPERQIELARTKYGVDSAVFDSCPDCR
jgi:pyruvate ferredoxin oxidoreductase beta subunit